MSEMQVRRLVYSDLPAVLSIERRAFETPWSLAMFVLELSKPSGICLALTDGDGLVRLSGLLSLCRRLAPDEHRRGTGTAAPGDRAPAARAAVRRGRPRRALHARGPHVESRGDRHVRAARLSPRRAPSSLLPRQRRGRLDHVARGHRRPSRLDPRDRDLLRRHLRRGHRWGSRPLQRDLLAGCRSRALRRGGARRSHRGITSSSSTRWSMRRWPRPRWSSRGSNRLRSPAGRA